MDPNYIFNILAQIPFLAAFIWYFDRASRQFQEFLREERAAREKNSSEERQARQLFEEKIIGRFEKLDNEMEKHNADFVTAIKVMEERTKQRRTQ